MSNVLIYTSGLILGTVCAWVLCERNDPSKNLKRHMKIQEAEIIALKEDRDRLQNLVEKLYEEIENMKKVEDK